MKKDKVLLPTGERWRIGIRRACILATLLLATISAHAVRFRLPLSSDTAVHYYYDHNTSSGVTAWNCSGSSYNGHGGSDFSGGPRGRAIFASASGTLIYKIDGFGDGYAGSPDGGGAGNHVRIDHGGGVVTWYDHMTVGSVTGRPVGSGISCGEQVGGVGTSGSSTGLHLHLTLQLSGANRDPFIGGCGGLGWWVNQGSGSPSTACEIPEELTSIDNMPVDILTPDGRLVSFGIFTDGSVRVNAQVSAGGAWGGFQSIGGSGFSQIDAAQYSDGRFVCFGVGGAGSVVWVNAQIAAGGNWGGWQTLAGPTFSYVRCIRRPDDRLVAFAVGNGTAVWVNTQITANGAWGGWQSIGGTGFEQIDPQLYADGRFVCLGVGNGTTISVNAQTTVGGSWSGWSNLGGPTFIYVRSALHSDGRLTVFGVGNGTAIWRNRQLAYNGSWQGFQSLGGSAFTKVDPVLMPDGRLVCFGTGWGTPISVNAEITAGGSWGGFQSLGGSGFTTVDGLVRPDGRLVGFGNGPGTALWVDNQNAAGGSWSGWTSLGGTLK